MGGEILFEIQQLLDLGLKRWNELPEYNLYSEQLIDLVIETVKPFYPENEIILTSNMINNYVKSNLIPRSVNKKYTREHMVYLIVLSLLKPILTLEQIRKGIDLQLKILTIEEAYNEFCSIFENTFSDVFTPVLGIIDSGSIYEYSGFKTSTKNVVLSYAIISLCFKKLTEISLHNNGLYGGKK